MAHPRAMLVGRVRCALLIKALEGSAKKVPLGGGRRSDAIRKLPRIK